MISKALVFCSLVIVLSSKALAAPPASKYWDDPKVQSLAEAGKAGDAKKIAKLIAEGAPVNAVGREGFTPLAYTMLSQSKTGFVALLKNGADPNILGPGLPGGDGLLAGLAAQAEELFWLEQLAAAGADLNIASVRSAQSPIYFAISYNRVGNARFLVDKKVNLEFVDISKYTPLQHSAVHNKWEIAYILIEAGSDWKKPFVKGQTIIDAIRRFSDNPNTLRKGPFWEWRNKVILLLKSKGCEIPSDLLASAKES